MPASLTRSAAVLLAAAMFAAACAGPSHDVSRRSPAMVLFDGAKNVEYGLAGAEESIAYDVAPPLALDAARRRIDAALRKDGWKPVTNQAPFHYVDARGTREPIDSWRGTWQRGGNTVEYIVQRHPDFLHVWAGLAPSSQSASHGAAPAQPAPSPPAVEQPRPHEIDAGAAHVAAGPYDVLWSPAEVRMSGSRDAPQTLLGGTSRLSFAPSIEAHRMTGAKLGAVRLDDACR